MQRSPANQYLPFIFDSELLRHVKKVIDTAEHAEEENNIYSNAIDPFSAVFDIVRKKITTKLWLELEKTRQVQKTNQNAIGVMHQEILGSIPGWENMGTGQVFDLKNDSLQIIAEVKNKWNTVKGSNKNSNYDDLKSKLKGELKGYTGYLVEIIPHNKARYNKPFQPSDNRIHQKRQKNERIRTIDGYSFYELASGQKNALEALFLALPRVIADILDQEIAITKLQKELLGIFKKTY
ncbi:MAG: Eco47II family restriction endonuclease [Patescibacteria group bacterium]